MVQHGGCWEPKRRTSRLTLTRRNLNAPSQHLRPTSLGGGATEDRVDRPARSVTSEPAGAILLITKDPKLVVALSLACREAVAVFARSSIAEGVYCIDRDHPEIGIVDLLDGDPDALLSLRILAERYPDLETLIVLDTAPTDDLVALLMAVKVGGFVVRPVDLELLCKKVYAMLTLKVHRTGPEHRLSRFVLRTIEFVAAHYPTVQIKEIGKGVGVSQSYLSHRFHTETGMTLQHCIALARVEAARYLLSNSSDKLEVIAEEVGFCDVSHLSRVFQLHYSQSPGRYRSAHRAVRV